MRRRSAGTLILSVMILTLLLVGGHRARSDEGTETIVLVRHGEKPDKGLGQLNCQGLNRALALPRVIATTFGRPDAVFAPDPSQQKKDFGVLYDYVRPLATIEPTAVYFGLPVFAGLGFTDTEGLRTALEQPIYRNAVVLVAWEHILIETIARSLLAAHGGDPALVPKWRGDDFDSIYVVAITRTAVASKATFELGHEGLNGQSDTCPG